MNYAHTQVALELIVPGHQLRWGWVFIKLKRWPQFCRVKITFTLPPTNSFVSAMMNSMKCLVNWIPLRIHVRWKYLTPPVVGFFQRTSAPFPPFFPLFLRLDVSSFWDRTSIRTDYSQPLSLPFSTLSLRSGVSSFWDRTSDDVWRRPISQKMKNEMVNPWALWSNPYHALRLQG